MISGALRQHKAERIRFPEEKSLRLRQSSGLPHSDLPHMLPLKSRRRFLMRTENLAHNARNAVAAGDAAATAFFFLGADLLPHSAFFAFYSAVTAMASSSTVTWIAEIGFSKESMIFWEIGSSSSRWMTRRRFRAP